MVHTQLKNTFQSILIIRLIVYKYRIELDLIRIDDEPDNKRIARALWPPLNFSRSTVGKSTYLAQAHVSYVTG